MLASLGLAAGVIDPPLYVAMLTMVASSIAVSSVAVRFVGPPSRRDRVGSKG